MNHARQARADARVQAAELAFTRLRAAESAIEQAYSATADLAADLPRLRAQANLSTVVAHDAVDAATRTMFQLSGALESIVATHGCLANLKGLLGLRHVASGPQDKSPEDPPRPRPYGALDVVEGGRPA